MAMPGESPLSKSRLEFDTLHSSLANQVEAARDGTMAARGLLSTINQNTEALSQRVALLEKQMIKEKQQRVRDVEEASGSIMKQLQDFQTAFEMERVSRMEREQQILKRIGEEKLALEERLLTERSSREAAYQLLRDEMGVTVDRIYKVIKQESATREESEAQILQALNQYSVLLEGLTASQL